MYPERYLYCMASIRRSTPRDADALAAIFNQYLGNGTMVLRKRPARYYRDLMQQDNCCLIVSEAEAGDLLGYASVGPYSDRQGYQIAGEVSVFLRRAACGRGLGHALYDALWPACRQLGYLHLTAKIWAENTSSVRFHERHGFTSVGPQRAIGMVQGRRIDVLVMEKLLD